MEKRVPFYTADNNVNWYSHCVNWGFLSGLVGETPPATQELQETQVGSLGHEDPLEEGMAIHSSILAYRMPRTEESGRLQSIGSQRVRHTKMTEHTHIVYNNMEVSQKTKNRTTI